MKEVISYTINGVCSKHIEIQVNGSILEDVKVNGSCPDNLLGISKILVGKNVKEVIDTFSGVKC